jgi:hypothetical protein
LITKFRVEIPATAFYWDIQGSIDFEMQAADGRQHAARYQAVCTDRTFVFPIDALIAGVVQACLQTIGAKLRADAVLVSLVEGP